LKPLSVEPVAALAYPPAKARLAPMNITTRTPPPAADAVQAPAIALPRSVWQAIGRGLRFACPRCGEAHLFDRFLKPAKFCIHCGQDWTPQRADDFPAYISMLITGHLLAPVIIALVNLGLSTGVLIALIIPSASVLLVALLQPAKGAVIALQWWNGMHGFQRERIADL
jgi:uncharacterized protein (DUF983 family)